jgi:hypothetical protein
MTERELARRSTGDGGLVLRAAPLRLRWELEDLVAGDGHRLRCTFACGVRAVDRPADRRMLEEALLDGRDAVTADVVVAHFAPALRAAATRVAADRAGEAWLADGADRTLADALKQAGDALAFASGVELLAPVEVELHSPTLERQKLEAMERQLAERRAAGQVEHVQRATALLREFEQLRQAAPSLSAGRILERISPTDRGSMLEALLMASGDDGATAKAPPVLFAVAGPHLVRVDPQHEPPRVELIELPQDLGPFRSARVADAGAERRLVLGARSGLMIVDPASPRSSPKLYRDDSLTSPLGFNRAVYWGNAGGICGTHGDAGVVRWDVGEPSSPRARHLLTSARNLCKVDASTLAFSVGSQLYLLPADGEPAAHPMPGAGSIMGVELSDRALHVVRDDGTVHTLDRTTRELLRTDRRCGRVSAVASLPWLGDVRLLLATEDGPVCCVGADDPVVTQYVSPHRGLKVVAAGGGYVAGVSGDRQRLVLWHAWDGRRPIAEVHVGAQARHRVADACVG